MGGAHTVRLERESPVRGSCDRAIRHDRHPSRDHNRCSDELRAVASRWWRRQRSHRCFIGNWLTGRRVGPIDSMYRSTFGLRAVEPVEKCFWECFREGTKSRPLMVRLSRHREMVDRPHHRCRTLVCIPAARLTSRISTQLWERRTRCLSQIRITRKPARRTPTIVIGHPASVPVKRS